MRGGVHHIHAIHRTEAVPLWPPRILSSSQATTAAFRRRLVEYDDVRRLHTARPVSSYFRAQHRIGYEDRFHFPGLDSQTHFDPHANLDFLLWQHPSPPWPARLLRLRRDRSAAVMV